VSFESCHPANPRRAVDWRWLAATGIRDGSLMYHPAWVDSWVHRAIAFQDALEAQAGGPGPHGLPGPDAAIAAACGLMAGEEGPARWHVQALLLAGEDDASIAARCGLTPEAVAACERLFFDVRQGLGRPTYILHQVIGVNRFRPERDLGRVWRLLGYSGGPLVVDFLAAGAIEGGEDLGAVGPTAPGGRDARLRRLVVNALSVDLDVAALGRIAPLLGELDQIESEADAALGGPLAAGFDAMIAGLDLGPIDAEDGDEGQHEPGESARSGAGSGHFLTARGLAQVPLARVGS
jgi:hypothetical protein